MKCQNILVIAAMVSGINANYMVASCKSPKGGLDGTTTSNACNSMKIRGCTDCFFRSEPDGSGNGGPPIPSCKSESEKIVPDEWNKACIAAGAASGVGS